MDRWMPDSRVVVVGDPGQVIDPVGHSRIGSTLGDEGSRSGWQGSRYDASSDAAVLRARPEPAAVSQFFRNCPPISAPGTKNTAPNATEPSTLWRAETSRTQMFAATMVINDVSAPPSFQ